MKTLEKRLEGQLIQNLIVQKMENLSQGQWFYSVIHYGDWDNDGNLREWDERVCLYRKQHMEGVHRRLRRNLREHFSNNISLFFTLERHQGTKERIKVCGGRTKDGKHKKYLQYGDERKGKYHTNLLIGPITDQLIEEPKSKLKRVLNTLSYHPYNDPTDLKIDLINSCIRLHPDVNKYGHSVKTQVLTRPQDLLNTGHYSLKDITKKGLDFMEVLDTENSDI